MQARAEATKEIYVDKLKEQLKAEEEVRKVMKGGWTTFSPAKVQNKADDLKKETSEYEKQFNIIANTVRLEQQRLKNLNKPDVIPTPTSTPTYSAPTKKTSGNKNQFPVGPGVQFSNPADAFKVGEPTENILAKEEVHWHKYADSVAEANRKAADATKLATQQMADAITGPLQQSLFSLSDAMTDTMKTSENAMERFMGGLANVALKLLSMALSNAIGNAIVGATASGAATGPAAIFTTPAFISTAVGGVLAAFSAIPKFADGGIVGGTSFTGDKVPALVNSGEMILNKSQQANLFSMIGSGGNGYKVQLVPIIDNRGLAVQVEIGKKQLGRG
jgi:hypothetical protein